MKKIYLFLFLLLCFNANAQWSYCNFPYGGNVSGIVRNPLLNNQLFVAVSGKVFTSTDEGNNWTTAYSGIQGDVTCLVAIDSMVMAASPYGLFFTHNKGISWSRNTYFADSVEITAMIAKGKDLYIGTINHGIYYSGNKGVDWSHVHAGLPADAYVNSFCFHGNELYAGTFSGIFRSTDGSNWKEANNGLPFFNMVFALTSHNNIIFAAIMNEVYFTTDTGDTWKVVESAWPQSTVVSALATDGSTLFAGTGESVYTSADNGATWTKNNTGIPAVTNVNTFGNTANAILAGTSKGVFLSADHGTSWQEKNNGLSAINQNTILSNGTLLFSGGLQNLYMSGDQGKTWAAKNTGLPEDLNIITLVNNDTGIFIGSNNGVYLSINNGDTWSAVSDGLPVNLLHVNELIARQQNLLLLHPKEGVYQSTNGRRWETTNGDLPLDKWFFCMAADQNNIILSQYQGSVYLSTNNGLNWVAVNNGLDPLIQIERLAIIDNTIYAGTQKGLYTTSDFGSSWQKISNPLLQLAHITCIQSTTAGIFVGTGDDLFFSRDQGKSWISIGTGLPYGGVNEVTINGNYVFAATSGRGIWYRVLSEITGVEKRNDETDFIIYPNPGNGMFNLSSSIANTQVQLFNSLGECVFQQQLNTSSVQLDLGHFSKGMYVISVINKDGITQNKKLLIQ